MEGDPVIEYRYKDVSYGRKIGNGSFGVVFEGTLKGQRIAIKVPMDKLRDDVLNELKFLAKLKHPNVVHFYGVLKEDSECINLLFEFLNGDARTFVAGQDRNVETLLGISYDIALGMDYIHDLNIIHRDLAARNVLVDSKNVAKISDFGLSRLVDQNHEHYTIKNGTMIPNYRWIPRECLQIGGKFSKSSDIWSFGVTLWEIWNKGQTPYGNIDKEQVKQAIFGGQNPMSFQIHDEDPVGIKQILNDIFVEKNLRPSFANIKILLNDIRKGNVNLNSVWWNCSENQSQKGMEGQSSNSEKNVEFFTAKSIKPELNLSEIEINEMEFKLTPDNVKILSFLKENNTVKDLECSDINAKKITEITRKFKVIQKMTFWHNMNSSGKCDNFLSRDEGCIFKLPQMNTYENLKELFIRNLEIDTGDVDIGSGNLPNLKKLTIFECTIRGDLVDTIVTHLFGLEEIYLQANTPLLKKEDVETLLRIKSLKYIDLNITWYGRQVIKGSFVPFGPDGKLFDKITQNAAIEFKRESKTLHWSMRMTTNKKLNIMYIINF